MIIAQANELVTRARAMRARAYAPYSKYFVGAAILGKDGKIYEGCNIENASYGGTVCAERVAVFNAVAAGCREFQAIAITTGGEKPAPPCGFCLQVLSEFSQNLPILLSAPTGDVVHTDLTKLLPFAFHKESLS